MTAPDARIRGKYVTRIGGKPTSPAVSSVLGLYNKPGLSWGAAKETALFAIHHQDEWIDADPEWAYNRLRTHHRGVWDDKAKRGTTVHGFAEQWAKGEAVDCPPELVGYLDALQKFYERYQPKWLACERTVIYQSPNGDLDFGGTPDALVTLNDGWTMVLDFNTGARYPNETTLQLAAYLHSTGFGIYDEFKTLIDVEPLPPLDGAAILYLHDDSTYELLEVPADTNAFAAFMHLRALWNWHQDAEAWLKKHPASNTERPRNEAVAS